MKSILAPIITLAVLSLAGPAFAGDGCPEGRIFRTPEQVMADHTAALATGNLDLIMCDYAFTAQVVMPGTVLRGKDQIRAGLAGMQALFGTAQPQITSQTVGDGVVVATWRLETPTVLVADGSDTFVILGGMIWIQTVHAPMQFR